MQTPDHNRKSQQCQNCGGVFLRKNGIQFCSGRSKTIAKILGILQHVADLNTSDDYFHDSVD